MITSNKSGNAALLIVVIVVFAVIGAWFFLAQSGTTNVNLNVLTVKKYQEAKTVLQPIFESDNSFESFRKDIVRDKVRLYLDYIYQRLEPIVNNEAKKSKYTQEIEHCLQNKKLNADEISNVKKFIYEAKEEKDFQDQKLTKEFFKQHKDVYIIKAYEKLNTILSK